MPPLRPLGVDFQNDSNDMFLADLECASTLHGDGIRMASNLHQVDIGFEGSVHRKGNELTWSVQRKGIAMAMNRH